MSKEIDGIGSRFYPSRFYPSLQIPGVLLAMGWLVVVKTYSEKVTLLDLVLD